jgi:hypothetical protein
MPTNCFGGYMANEVEDYAKLLLRNQATCVTTVATRRHDIIETARLMDIYLQRGWSNKLCEMPITKYDGFKNKIHTFAINLL